VGGDTEAGCGVVCGRQLDSRHREAALLFPLRRAG
jgi:hypothetical protein